MVSVAKIIVAGIILMIFLPVMFGGIAVLAVSSFLTDTDGYFATTDFNVQQNNATAVRMDFPTSVHSMMKMDLSNIIRFKIAAHDPSDAFVFIGITSMANANIYCSNLSYVLVTGLTDFNVDPFKKMGSPFNTTFVSNLVNGSTGFTTDKWIEYSSTAPSLEYAPNMDDLKGSLSVIIQNIPINNGVNITFNLGVKVPILTPIGWILIIFGGLFTLVGIIILWSGLRAKPSPSRIRYYQGAVAMPVQAPSMTSPPPPAQQQAKCSICGYLNEIDSKFCSNCGEVLMITAASPAQWSDKGIPSVPTDTLVVADGGQRFWAFVIDSVISGFISNIIFALFAVFLQMWDIYNYNLGNPGTIFMGIAPSGIIYFIYAFVMEYFCEGQTIGRMALHTQVVSQEDGQVPNVVQLLLSNVGKAFFLPLDCIIGLIIQKDDEVPKLNQRLSQRIGGVVVIEKSTGASKTQQTHFISSKVQ